MSYAKSRKVTAPRGKVFAFMALRMAQQTRFHLEDFRNMHSILKLGIVCKLLGYRRNVSSMKIHVLYLVCMQGPLVSIGNGK